MAHPHFKPKPLYTFCLCLALLLVSVSAAQAADPRYSRSWSDADSGDEQEGSFDERAHDLQNWLRQREAERRDSWGNDVVTPENPALRRAPRYFGDRNYDDQGYRRLNDNTRFRLRGDEDWRFGAGGHAGSLREAGRPLEEDRGDDAAASDDADSVAGLSHRTLHKSVKKRKRKRR
ncbi:hypothetical protein [Methyloterricola oryzae]|uniref:hypothetical protein n=1 Tax=Methyloterricola oryzae TaxID=1495050 RepID=UPI0005EBC5B0|nr:hypothetical protein [Methyloterricola oryzae]